MVKTITSQSPSVPLEATQAVPSAILGLVPSVNPRTISRKGPPARIRLDSRRNNNPNRVQQDLGFSPTTTMRRGHRCLATLRPRNRPQGSAHSGTHNRTRLRSRSKGPNRRVVCSVEGCSGITTSSNSSSSPGNSSLNRAVVSLGHNRVSRRLLSVVADCSATTKINSSSSQLSPEPSICSGPTSLPHRLWDPLEVCLVVGPLVSQRRTITVRRSRPASLAHHWVSSRMHSRTALVTCSSQLHLHSAPLRPQVRQVVCSATIWVHPPTQ